MDENKSSVVVDEKKYIVVSIGNEQYGIDIKYVDNIVRMQRITRVPKAQAFFKGVINLRGEIVPVMSVRLKFGLPCDEITNNTRIIILKTDAQAAIGLIVDEVKEVVDLDETMIDKITYNAKDEANQYLIGIGKHKDGLISLLNIAEVISEKENN